ncbi:MAG: c-type cytochrome, partial [Planctomycetales bacterium]|nr:c-type cytochrome [Planctomycetales bacterium]
QTDKILVSSELLQPRESQTLVFNAPQQPGIYPYVCTYPGHWRRMFGKLIVVEDLDDFAEQGDAYLTAKGLAPADEYLKMIRPARAWQLADLQPALDEFAHGRSYSAGKRMFQVATCVSCHRLKGEGNEFGPDLSKYDPKWQPAQLLKHMVEPSAEINKDYQTQTFELTSGQVVTGLVVSSDATTLKVVENPLASVEPRTIARQDVDSQAVSTKSLMPEGLLDRLTREEIMDLLAYIYSRADQQHEIYQEDGHAHHHH